MPQEMTIMVPEFAEVIMRALALKGDLPRELLAEFQLGLQVADFSDPSEWSWLRRTILYDGGCTVAAVAAQFGIAVFATRVGLSSNQRQVLAVLDQVILTNTAAAAMTFEYGVTLSGTGIADPNRQAYAKDDRGTSPTFATNTSAFAVGSGSNAAPPLGSSHAIVSLAPGASISLKGPWMLTNRDTGAFRSAFLVQAGTVNQAFVAAFTWRERVLNDSEREAGA